MTREENVRPPARWWQTAGAGALLALVLALTYGPSKLAGHCLYSGVIQDVTNLFGFFCWDEFSRKELLAGRFPLWNPHNGLGVPHLANMQTGIFYPLNWLKWLLGFWPVIDFLLLLRLWLAGMFTFLLARAVVGSRFFSSLLAAVTFMLSGYFVRHIYMSHLNVEILLPLQVLLLFRLAQRPTHARLLAAAAGFGLLVLGGFPEASLYAVAFSLLCYFLWVFLLPKATPLSWAREGRSSFSLAGVALSLGAFLSLLQWLPFTEYYSQAWTYHHTSSGLRHHDPRLAVALVLPWFFGENRFSPITSFLPGHVGLVPALLVGCLFVRLRDLPARALLWAALTVSILGLMYGLPPFSLIARLFPFSLTYNDKYSQPAFMLCIALAAAAVAEELSRRRNFDRLLWVAGAVTLWLGANIVFGYANLFRPVWALGLKYSPAMIPAAALLLAGVLVAGHLARQRRVGAAGFQATLFLLALAGLLFDLQGLNPLYHDDLREQREERLLAQALSSQTSQARLYVDPELKELFANRLLPVGLDDLRSYDPLYPRFYVEFFAQINNLSGEALFSHYFRHMLFIPEEEHLSHPLLALANVGFMVLSAPVEERLVVRRWAEEARTLSPRRESWLRADSVSCAGQEELVLIDHAPVRIDVPLPPRAETSQALLFDVGIPDNQLPGAEPSDGVIMTVINVSSTSRLLFCRYLDPKSRPEEQGWHPVVLEGDWFLPGEPSGLSLSLLPGPRNNFTRDAAAFGRLRFFAPPAERALRLMASGRRWFLYRNERAFPRAWWVSGSGAPPPEMDYWEAVKRVAAVNPEAFKMVAILAEQPPASAPEVIEAAAQERLEPAGYEPGQMRFQADFSRPGFLVLTDEYFPGFRAFLKRGRIFTEARIYPVNGPFMAVPVPPGPHEIEICYQPWSFRLGLWAALMTLAALAASVFVRMLSSGVSRSRPALNR